MQDVDFLRSRTRGASALIAAALTLAFGCDDPSATLVRFERVEVGDPACPTGGMRILQGRDSNSNGVLDDGEVTSTIDSCDARFLTSTAPIAFGDPRCPGGGVEVSYGVDDGDGGGTAGNGVLENGEVDHVEELCTDSGLAPSVGTDAPDGPAGTNVIRASGGDSTSGVAGSGGDVTFTGSNGVHHLLVFRTGSLEDSVSLPEFEVDLGDAPVEIGTSQTLANLPATPTDGLYYDDANGRLVIVEDGDVRVATGLHVYAGATLTLPDPPDDSMAIAFAGDVHLEGTLAVSNASDDIAIEVDDFWAAEGARIELATGELASSLAVYATRGRVVSAAHVNARGTEASGSVTFLGNSGLVNTGAIDTSGHDGPEPSDAGDVILTSHGALHNGGALTARGGAGVNAGGEGGLIVLSAGTVRGGALVNTATLDVSGGDATGALAEAGRAGFVQLLTYGVELTSTGDLLAMGGNAPAAGGEGGSIQLIAAANIVAARAPADVRADCSMDARGGNGEAGGSGGDVTVTIARPSLGSVVLYGVAAIESRGGDASLPAGLGGYGGSVIAVTSAPPDVPRLPAGALVFRTDLDVTGGSGGGFAGELWFRNETSQELYGTLVPGLPGVVLEGDVFADGGDDDHNQGGAAGYLGLRSIRDVTLDCDVSASGGSSLDGTTDSGGAAAEIVIASTSGSLEIDGSIVSVGGDGLNGGIGGSVVLSSRRTAVSGDVILTGGDGAVNGGTGGRLVFLGPSDTGVAGTVDVRGGEGGEEDGEDGSIEGPI